MKNIVVPCDFSKPSVEAFRFAVDVAAQSRGTVHLVHVIELPVLHDTVLMPVLSFEEVLLKELREKSDERFSKIITKYKPDNVKVVSKVLFGATTRMIEDYVDKESADVVIMGSHGASGFKEYFLGSNAERIVRNSTVPVLVLKDYYKGPVKNIVFPNTLQTENQEDLVMKVKALQHFFKASLHILWVNTPSNFSRDFATRQRLEAFAKRYMFKDYSIHIYNDLYEEDGIIRFTNEIKGALIAMGTHGRKGIGHLMTGSVAEDVVNHVKCPIWTYTIKKVKNVKK